MDETYPAPSLVIDALKVLTTPTQCIPGTDSSSRAAECQFDQLLAACTAQLDKTLAKDVKFTLLNKEWCTDLHIVVPSVVSVRWKYVLYCLKLLNILQLSLKESVSLYHKAEPRNIRPSGAPPVSPDTLSFGDQKVFLSAIQFIVCLGICPHLQKGVGLPVEIRSEFSKFIKSNDSAEDLTDIEKAGRLYICVEVLVLCIHATSLGTLILSRHLVDVLAALLQLTHSTGLLSASCTNGNHSQSDSTSRSKRIIIQHTDIGASDKIECERVNVSVTGAAADVSTASNSSDNPTGPVFTSTLTPASAVDIVRRKFQQTDPGIEPNQHNSLDHSATVGVDKHGDTSGNDGDTPSPACTCIDVDFCQQHTADLMGKIYPPLLVKTLLLLQGGPKSKKPVAGSQNPLLSPAPTWLRSACGQQLTAIIMKPKGVQSVLRGMLDNPTGPGAGMGQAADWRKCDAVAKVIACCPLQSVSVEAYYRTVAPQLLEVLHIKDKQVARQFLRVACSTIANMAARHRDLTRDFVITPLLRPLLRCTQPQDDGGVNPGEPRVVVDEEQVSGCVEDCHRVFVSGATMQPDLVICLDRVILAVFELYVFTKSGVSSLKTSCHELLVCFLKQCDVDIAKTCLELMAFQQTTHDGAELPRMQCNLEFANGGTGGVVVVGRPNESEVSRGSQDDRVTCMVDLLRDLQSTGTAGQFLIFMLQELTKIIGCEIDGDTDDCNQTSPGRLDGQPLLELEERQQLGAGHWFRKLTLLSLLAAVCDALGPTCITNTRDTLQFVKATLERAVQVCRATEDSVFAAFENETLTMAMGLLTATMSGGLQMTEADRTYLNDLLPLLLNIENHHPDISVQELASDLRIAISTRGIVWSQLMKSTSANIGKKVPKPARSTKTTNKARIEELSTCELDTPPNHANPQNHANPHSHGRPQAGGKGNLSQHDQLNIQQAHITGACPNDAHTKTGVTATQKNESANETGVNVDPGDLDAPTKQCSSKSATANNSLDPDSRTSMSELQQAFTELCDPLIPVRGHALITLTNLIRRRDPEACEKKDLIYKVFHENLSHTDSYLYLSSVNGLAAMAELYPDMVVAAVCEQFVGTAVTERSAETEQSAVMERSAETRMKLGEILVKASRSLGDMMPQYKAVLLSTVLRCVRDTDPLVRASGLCNLGEICKLLHFSLGGVTHEVFACCSGLLKSDPDVEVRKAAAAALTLLLQGVGKDAVKILDTVLRDVYRLLKVVVSQERDDTVKLHAHLALNELDDIMRASLFPEQKLEKRIRVLDVD